MTPLELKQLAARHGVQSAYRRNDGGRASASQESLLAILRALGAVDSDGRAVDAGDAGTDSKLQLQPVNVIWEGERPAITVRLRSVAREARTELALTLESGERREWQAVLEASAAEENNEASITCRVPLPALPRGYHTLSIHYEGYARETTLIAAPRRCFGGDPGRRWGLFAPVYALHDDRTLEGAPR